MAIPAIITNSVTSIGAITTTSTTVITPKLPPSDIVLALTLGTLFACDDAYFCSLLVNGNGGDDDTISSIEVNVDSGDDDTICSVKVDGDSGDDDSVDQQKMEQLFH